MKIRLQTILFCFIATYSIGQSKADSLRSLLRSAKDTTRVRLYFELANMAKLRSAVEEGLAYCDSAHRTFAKLSPGDKQFAQRSDGNVYSVEGILWFRKGEFAKALEADTLGLNMRKAAKDQRGVAASYSNLGILYDNQGDYSRAIEYHYMALRIREELKDSVLIASTLGNLGEVYRGQKEYDKAQALFQRSFNAVSGTFYVNSVDPLVIQARGNALNNLALLFENKGDLKRSLEYHFRALEIRQKAGDSRNISASYNNIALAYLKLGQVDSALAYHQRSLELKKKAGDKYGLAISYCNLSQAYLQKGDATNALENIRLSLKISNDIGAISLQKEGEQGLAEIFDALHQPDSAYRHYRKFITLRDSIYNIDNAKKSLRTEMEYNFQKERERKQLEQEKKDAVAAEAQRRQKVILWSVIGGMIVVLSFSLLLLNRFRLIRKQKAIIELQKNSLEEKQSEIMDSMKYASRIQRALLPNEKNVHRNISRLKD